MTDPVKSYYVVTVFKNPKVQVAGIFRSSEQMQSVFLTLVREDFADSIIATDKLAFIFEHGLQDVRQWLVTVNPIIEVKGRLDTGLIVAKTHAEIVLVNLLRNAIIHSPICRTTTQHLFCLAHLAAMIGCESAPR